MLARFQPRSLFFDAAISFLIHVWDRTARVPPAILQPRSPAAAEGFRLFQIAQRASRGAGLDKFSPAQVISTGLMLARLPNRHF